MSSTNLSRRDFLRISTTAATGAFLAACAPATQQGSGAGQEPGAETVELRVAMYSYEPWLRLLGEIFTEFEEQNSNVTVSLESAPWDQFWPKIEAQAQTGEAPHISITERMESWGAQGWLQELDYVLEPVDTDIFFSGVTCASMTNPDTWTTGCQSGGNTLWGFPGTGVATVVYLNLDLLDEAGLDYPDEDWDWDDFREYAIALTADGNGRHPGDDGFDMDNRVQFGLDEGFIAEKNLKTWIWHAGGRRWNEERTECLLHDNEAMAAINNFNDLIQLGVVPAGGMMEGVAQPFLTGQIGMHVTGSWNVDTWATELTDFNWDIQRLPMGPAGPDFRHSHTAWSNNLCMFKDVPNQDVAAELFEYALMTKEGTRWFGTAGVPTVRAAAEDPAWIDYPDGQHLPPHRDLQLTVMEEETWQQKYTRWIGYAELQAIIQEGLDLLALQRITPQEYADRTCEQIVEAFDRIREQYG